MKQTLTALLLALTMLFSLTGCTRKDKPNDSMNNGGNSGITNNGTANNGTNNGAANDGNTNNGTMNGGTNSDANNSTANNGDNSPTARSWFGTYNSHGAPGSNSSTDSESSDSLMGDRSYDQMLRDGRIHDSDGFLTDGENSRSDR